MELAQAPALLATLNHVYLVLTETSSELRGQTALRRHLGVPPVIELCQHRVSQRGGSTMESQLSLQISITHYDIKNTHGRVISNG